MFRRSPVAAAHPRSRSASSSQGFLSSIWFQLALAIGGGVWWAFCFDERPGFLVPLAAAVPLCLIAGAPLGPWRRFWLGWLHGAVAWMVAVPWLSTMLGVYGGLPVAASAGLVALLALYLGAYHGVFCWLAGLVLRRRDALSLAAAPALWVGLELLRGAGLAGFPWNLLAYAWVDVPGALDVTRWIGSLGLSGVVVAFGLALSRLVSDPRNGRPGQRQGGFADGATRRQAATVVAGVAVLLAVARWTNLDPPSPAGPVLDVRVVQPNIGMMTDAQLLDGPDYGSIHDNYRRLFELSREACTPGALVVWPESAGWPYELERDASFAGDVESLVAGGCSLLFNSARRFGSGDDEGAFNSAYLLTPGDVRAARQTYDKMHLVPFGEYVPLARYLPGVRQLARNTGSFSAGDEVRLLDLEGARLGISICFEIVFPRQVAARVRRGASVLVTMANDSWYGATWAPHQHLRPARFRAAENGRPLIRAAITGISAFIDHRGRILATAGIDEAAVLRMPVAPVVGATPFSRAPLLVPLLCLAMAAFAILRR